MSIGLTGVVVIVGAALAARPAAVCDVSYEDIEGGITWLEGGDSVPVPGQGLIVYRWRWRRLPRAAVLSMPVTQGERRRRVARRLYGDPPMPLPSTAPRTPLWIAHAGKYSASLTVIQTDWEKGRCWVRWTTGRDLRPAARESDGEP